MDVRLPDGTTIKNVPEGTTKAQLVEKLNAKGYDTSWYKPEAPAAQETPAPTASDRTNAAIGGLNRGIAGLAGLPVDTLENIINLGLAAYGASKQAITGQPGPDLLQGSVGGSQYIADKLQRAGVNTQNPRPDDSASRMLNAAGQIVGGSLVPGAGIRNTAAAAAGGALAGELLGPQYTGVGAMLPGAAAQAASAAKTAIANPQTVQRNLETFKAAGTQPDVAQATESNFLRGLTNVVGRFPGGQGIIAKFRENEQEALGKSAKTGVSAEKAGRAIKQGITGEGGFIERSKATWDQLDAELAKKAGGVSVSPQQTVTALDALTTPTPGAEKTTAGLVNPKLAQMKADIQADLQANGGVMPFDALRALRAKVGTMLDNNLVSGIDNGELKRVYGALSKDLEAAAQQAGAGKEFDRQSNYYKARMERIENTLDKVLGDGKTYESIFKSVAPTDIESVNTIRRVYRSLDPSQRQIVTDAIVNRMGRAAPGQQDATGGKFSSETFLSNWSRINDSAKAQLFPDEVTRKKVDAIAAVSADIRDSKTPFANNSGTAQGVTAGAIYGSVPLALSAAVTGHPAAAIGAIAASSSLVAGANIGARMLTSPKVIDWLAKSAKVKTPEQTTAQLGRLAVIFNETKDQSLKQELADYISSVK